MKKLLLLTLAIGLLSVSAIAQDAGPRNGGSRPEGGEKRGPGGGMRMGMRGGAELKKIQDRVLTKVGATAQQKQAIDKLNKETEAKMKKFREANKGSFKPGEKPDKAKMEKMMAEMRKLSEAHSAGMKKILGDKKFASYQKMMQEEMKKLREQRGKNGKPPKRG